MTNSSKKRMEYIPCDVISKILSYLPPKTLFRFRCVSKEIQRLIQDPLFGREHLMRLTDKTPFTGFFKNYNIRGGEHIDSPLFICTAIYAGGLPDSSLSFLEENMKSSSYSFDQGSVDENMESSDYSIDPIDSCKGLLLCNVSCHVRTSPNSIFLRRYDYICNPLTQQILLIRPFLYNLKSSALMVESTLTVYLQYKIVCVYNVGWVQNRGSKLSIFSSESGEWENFDDELPFVVADSTIKLRSKVYVNGVLFWDCYETGSVLVCYFNNKNASRCFQLIESPTDAMFFRCLWECSGKIMFCTHRKAEFIAWSLCCSDENNKFEWKIESPEQCRTLAEDIWIFCHGKTRPDEVLPTISELCWRDFHIVAYNPSSKTVYVWIYQALLSYHIEERRTELVSGFLHGSETRSPIPYLHSFGPIEA